MPQQATNEVSSPMNECNEVNGVSGVVMLIPTEGAYQKTKQAKIVNETKTLIHVSVDGVIGNWTFSKKDMLRTGIHKYEFPRWKINLQHNH